MHRPASRRLAILLIAVALAAVACSSQASSGSPGSTDTGSPPTPESIAALKVGASQIGLIPAESQILIGRSLYTFGLSTPEGGLIEGGTPQLYAAKDLNTPALGPFPATFYRFTAYDMFHDQSPKSPLTGFYAAEVKLPDAGTWVFAAVAQSGSTRAVGTDASTPVVAGPVANQVGSKATSVATPVGTTVAQLKQICTRTPPDDLHAISVDKALQNGKPTVVVFATPLLCESRMCGPVVDEVLLARSDVGAQKANWIHVEEFLPGPSLSPPPPTLENQSPGFKAWGLTSEPWVFVIDRKGIIRAAFEGPVVGQQIEAALRPLL